MHQLAATPAVPRATEIEPPAVVPQPTGETPARYQRLALVGNPNVGKSVIFGALTGTYAIVSNYPGTTVEVTRAKARRAPDVEIVDTPGINSLTPNSEDERVTRDILLGGVDCVVQVADAKNLARALVLSLQLAEAGVPFVFVLNMMDEAADRGLHIDVQRLSEMLGVPVVPTIAVRGQGLRELRAVLRDGRVSDARPRYDAAIEGAIAGIEPLLTGFPVGARFLALMCLGGDDTLRDWLVQHLPAAAVRAIEDARRNLLQHTQGTVGYQMSRLRVQTAARLAGSVTSASRDVRAVSDGGRASESILGLGAVAGCAILFAADAGAFSAPALNVLARCVGWLAIGAAVAAAYVRADMRTAIGRWASRRGSGVAMLIVVLYIVYRFVGVFAAGTVVEFLEKTLFGQYLNPLITAAVDRAAALGGGSVATATVARFLRDLLVGPYGLVTVALTYSFAIIFPIVTAFFLVFSILEDSGYLPRLAVIVNNVFRGMGLNGKAVLPMVLGLGCDTMATLTARIMESRRERVLVTLLLALGVPCSAQLGVILGLFGALPWWAAAVWGGVVLSVLFGVGALAARLLPGERSELILEVPPIRRPQLANIVIKTVGRLEWYLKEAVPVFVIGTFVLFMLDATGALSRIVAASEPAVSGLLNLPAKAAEAFLIGFFRRDYGSAGIYTMFGQGMLSAVQAVVALVTITLFVPCVANFFIIVKEHGMRTAVAMSAFIFPFAVLVGSVVNLALRAVGLQ